MAQNDNLLTLGQLLDRLQTAGNAGDHVELHEMLSVAGRRAFGPVLLVPGLIALSPLSGIPGMPSLLAIVVVLTSLQLLAGRTDFWLPGFLLHQKITRRRLEQAVRFLRPVARFVDRLLRQRLTILTDGAGQRVLALAALLIAITMPPLELLPFASTSAGAVLTIFGVSIIAHDGLVALLAMAFTLASAGTLIAAIFG